jgi:hypothetical protein
MSERINEMKTGYDKEFDEDSLDTKLTHCSFVH